MASDYLTGGAAPDRTTVCGDGHLEVLLTLWPLGDAYPGGVKPARDEVMAKKTNEWEFQGEVLSWTNEFLASHSLGLDRATQEFPHERKRSDLIIWRNHSTHDAVLASELKTPTTSLTDRTFQEDAIGKARRVGAPYVALWNMRTLVLYRTPAFPRKSFLASDRVPFEFPQVDQIAKAEDWLEPANKVALRSNAHELVRAIHDLTTLGSIGRTVVDATVFVSALTEEVRRLRSAVRPDVETALSTDRRLRNTINEWATKQGLTAFVAHLDDSLAAQLVYRLVGQVLFYHAFRRQEASLPDLKLDSSRPAMHQLRAYWDVVRTFDYEALFGESPLEQIPLGPEADVQLSEFVGRLAGYDWNKIDLDVLGSIFEHMIPESERVVLGQYYTPAPLADLLVALTVEGPDSSILDPAVGTGTFLFRAYDRLINIPGTTHDQLLPRLWGVDISAFAAELATINVCRLDLSSQANFPRLAVSDFFDLTPATSLDFPPAKRMPGSNAHVTVPLPAFDTVIGNPPYVRSQQIDDLDASYKDRLARMAYDFGVRDGSKLDLFAYFIVHSAQFLKPGGRLGFVTSAAWLTASYGTALKRLLLAEFNIVMIVWSECEPFFPGVEVNTVLLVAERLSDDAKKLTRTPIRFVTLTTRLVELTSVPSGSAYWRSLDDLTSKIETAPVGQHDGFRIAIRDGEAERVALRDEPKELRNWARPLRASDVYTDIFGAP